MANDNYNTYDLGLAAVLSVLGFELLEKEMERSNPPLFVFKPDGRKGGIEEIADSYFKDTLSLPPQRFFNALKMLKNRIYSNN